MSVSRKLCIGAARLPGLGRVQLSVMCGCERCGGAVGAVVLLQTAAAVGTGDLDQWEQWDNPDRELRSFWNSGA